MSAGAITERKRATELAFDPSQMGAKSGPKPVMAEGFVG